MIFVCVSHSHFTIEIDRTDETQIGASGLYEPAGIGVISLAFGWLENFAIASVMPDQIGR